MGAINEMEGRKRNMTNLEKYLNLKVISVDIMLKIKNNINKKVSILSDLVFFIFWVKICPST